MFQFDDLKAPPGKKRGQGAPANGEDLDRAILSWAEHCIECAAPSCYSSCDLYDPTPLGKCRRFELGVVPAEPIVPGRRAAEVEFRRWAKLEAQGNSTLVSAKWAGRAERLLEGVAPALTRIGSVMARVTRDERWLTVNEALHKRVNELLRQRRKGGPAPNLFVADILNPGAEPVELRVTATVDKLRLPRELTSDQLPRPMTLALTAEPGQSHHELAVDEMQELLGSDLPFLLSVTVANDARAKLTFGRLDFVRRPVEKKAAAPVVQKRPNAKCVVFDLDNTLWSGVLLEGEVKLTPGIEQLFRTLDERGILISVVSKNAHDDAIAQLRTFGLHDFFLYPQIGWQPKSASLKQLAKLIDIGSDTLIFIDDNPFERAEVAETLPEIEVLDETSIATLADHPRLQGAVTQESRTRRLMYQQAAKREETASAFGNDYLGFLKSCGIEVEIRRDRPEDFERIVELVQRTNQLNFSGRKYDREAITAILADPAQDRYVVAVSDKFGAYGLVGFCLARTDGAQVTVQDFMLSCRVQGKFIEQALFWFLTRDGADRLKVNFKRTDRNRAAEMVLEKIGFGTDAEGLLELDLRTHDLAVDFLTLRGDS